MAKTVANIKLAIAYRMSEDGVPNDTSEAARRLHFINEAYRDIMRRNFWWFTETTDSFDSVADQDSYTFGTGGVPSDIRAILELRFQDKLYTQQEQKDAMDTDTVPYKNSSQSYFIYGNEIYFNPPLSTTVVDGVAIKYYKKHTDVSSDSDTFLIPDEYIDSLVAYVVGRLQQFDSERGSAADAFEEYKEILSQMQEEQNMYLFGLKSSGNQLEAQFP